MSALHSLSAIARRPSRRPSLWAWVKRSVALARQRRALADMPAHLLRDIGVGSGAARKEAERPFWDAPDSWRL